MANGPPVGLLPANVCASPCWPDFGRILVRNASTSAFQPASGRPEGRFLTCPDKSLPEIRPARTCTDFGRPRPHGRPFAHLPTPGHLIQPSPKRQKRTSSSQGDRTETGLTIQSLFIIRYANSKVAEVRKKPTTMPPGTRLWLLESGGGIRDSSGKALWRVMFRVTFRSCAMVPLSAMFNPETVWL